MHASSADGAWLERGANQGSGRLCPGTTGVKIPRGDVAQDSSTQIPPRAARSSATSLLTKLRLLGGDFPR